jgi:hypothetical protein
MNQFQIICGMKPLKCPSDVIRSLSESVSRQFCHLDDRRDHIKSIKKDDVIPPLSDTKTMPELAKQCQNVRVKYVLSRNFVISTGEITQRG